MPTPNLDLPFLEAGQSQKHVTHNEALTVLDALVQLAVLDRHLSTPPASPAAGARYIVAAGATGAWAGHAGAIAVYQDGGWMLHTPDPGWLAYVVDEATFAVCVGAAWVALGEILAAVQNVALLGIGTAADAANPFSAKLNKALWTAKTAGEGGTGDLRYTLNKEAAANVLSLLLQSNWSGRAELGLIGDDNLTLKVSPDGAAWKTALVVDRGTGKLSAPEHSKFSAYCNFGQDYAAGAWRDMLFNNTRHNDQGDFASVSNVGIFTAPHAGYFLFGLGATYEAGAAPTKMQIGLGINGADPTADTIGTTGDATAVSGETAVRTTALLRLSAGDLVRGRVFFTTNAGRIIANENHFWGSQII